MQITYQPIGTISTPYLTRDGMPIQPTGAEGIRGTIEVYTEFAPGLADLNGFSHIILIYDFHQSSEYQLKVIPFLDSVLRGVFSTRAPKRPNSIGLSIVKLIAVKKNILTVENIDILNGTPLLDIKPYVPEFDRPTEFRLGWLEKARGEVKEKRSDKRFK